MTDQNTKQPLATGASAATIVTVEKSGDQKASVIPSKEKKSLKDGWRSRNVGGKKTEGAVTWSSEVINDEEAKGKKKKALLQRQRVRLFLWWAGSLTILIVCVVLSIVFFLKYATSETTNTFSFNRPGVTDPNAEDGIILNLKTTTVDFISNRITYNLRVYPTGKYLSNKQLMVSTTPISLVMDIIERKLWTTPDSVSTQTQNNPFDFLVVASGSLTYYPFDTHTNNFTCYAWEGTNTSAIVPVNLKYTNIAENYIFTVTPSYFGFNNTRLLMTVTVSRTTSTKVFSLFTAALMWILGIAVSRFAVDAITNVDKKIEGPVMGVCIAMLFAVPALRNTQPNIPPIGVLADVMAFFWAELAIIFTALTQIILYTVQKARESAKLRNQIEKGESPNMDDANAATTMDVWGDAGSSAAVSGGDMQFDGGDFGGLV